MPSYAYKNLPPPASTYQTPFKQQYQQPPPYHSQNQNQNQNQHQANQSQPIFQSHSSPNYRVDVPPMPITYNLTPQYKLFSDHIIALYYQDSHEKYYRWSEEEIAIDLASRSIIDGVPMDIGSDVEVHAVEADLVLVGKGAWRFCEGRAERIMRMVRSSM